MRLKLVTHHHVAGIADPSSGRCTVNGEVALRRFIASYKKPVSSKRKHRCFTHTERAVGNQCCWLIW
jgi:hypothetical protein